MNTNMASLPEDSNKELPPNWRWARLGDVCQIITGQSPPSSAYRDRPNGLPFFQGKADFGNFYPIARVWCVEPIKTAEPGDILISVRAPVGPTNIADVQCCIGRGLAAIRCHSEVDPIFVLHALRRFGSNLIKQSTGSTFGGISRAHLENFEIPLPPLSEQRHITKKLNEQIEAVERARNAAQAQLDAAKALSTAYLREVFPQSGQKLPPGWRSVKLGALLIQTRNGIYKPERFYGRGTPILRMFNIGRLNGSWILEPIDHIELTDTEFSAYCLNKGDILLNRVNSRELVGKCAVVNELTSGAVFESKNMRLRLDQSIVSPHFVATYLNGQGGRMQIDTRLKQIVGQATINRSDLDGIDIPIPRLAEQQRIVAGLTDRMETSERLYTGLGKQLTEIKALLAALLRKAFKGGL